MSSVSRSLFLAVALCASASVFAQVTNPATPNSDPIYQQLRGVGLGSEAVTVNNFDLKRDAATFRLRSGKVCFLSAVQGKVTGAVFEGEGSLSLTPPLLVENKMLKLLTKEDVYNENFNRLVLRFTDTTYDDLKKSNPTAPAGCDAGPLQDSQNVLKHKIYYNLTGRLLEDVVGTEPGGLFVAFIHGKKYEDKQIFVMDPHGAPNVEPEEISLTTYNDNKFGIWAAFRGISERHRIRRGKKCGCAYRAPATGYNRREKRQFDWQSHNHICSAMQRSARGPL